MDFWNFVKLLNKSSTVSGEILIHMAEIMNDVSVNVAAEIGKCHTVSDLQNHHSIF